MSRAQDLVVQLLTVTGALDVPMHDPEAVYCIECFNPVAEDSERCPHCGVMFAPKEKEATNR